MRRGFTLIQVIFFVSCFALIGSFLYRVVLSNRLRAHDTANRVMAQKAQTAINAFIIDNGRPPRNYGVPGLPSYERDLPDTIGGKNAYEKSMAELVPKYIAEVPHSQGGNFAYYDYGPDTPMGALFVSAVTTAPPTPDGYGGSCRPFHELTITSNTDEVQCRISKSCYKKPGVEGDELCLETALSCPPPPVTASTYAAFSSTTGSTTGKKSQGGPATKRIISEEISNWCTKGISSTDDCYCAPYGR